MGAPITSFHFPGPIIFGDGSSASLSEHLARLKVKKPLFVCTSRDLDFAGSLIKKPFSFHLHTGREPTDKDVAECLAAYNLGGCDSLVAIGGGSRIDLAKATRVLASHRTSELYSYYVGSRNQLQITNNMPALICVPTIAGSGSETSNSAFIRDKSSGRKRFLSSPYMVPSLTIIDPLLYTAPPKVAAASAMDALAHAIECSVGTNYSPICESLAHRAFTIINDQFIQAFVDDKVQNYDATQRQEAIKNIAMASAIAGMCFAKGLGVCHSIAHAVGTICDSRHADLVTVLTPHCIEFNNKHANYSPMLICAGFPNGHEDGPPQTYDLWSVSSDFARYSHLPQRLRDLAVKKEHFQEIADKAMLDHVLLTNPRPVTREHCLKILEKAW